ncbi:MAG TPA: hypothetical protein VFV59_07215 [Candidatus Limnocylindria bacterium]|nr:hypothetical protein [Candidatus Limnocylindria bacterium]
MIGRVAVAGVLLLGGCGSVAPRPSVGEAIFFPTHEHTPQTGLPAGAIAGTLALEDGCLWVVTDDNTPLLALWPSDFRLETEQGRLIVIGRGGSVPLGGRIHASGGEYATDQVAFVEQQISAEIPDACRGRGFWLVGELMD